MNNRHLITLMDWSREDIEEVLSSAHKLKKNVSEGALSHSLSDKTLALVFEKASMRTRVSFEVGMTQLGGTSVYLSKDDVNLGKREPVKDGARVLARYVDGVAARVYEHEVVEELAEYSSVPIINALSDFAHPCQALADIMTLQEQFADVSSLTVAYIGDANNVARSLAVACAKLGVDYRIAAPDDYQFAPEFEESVEEIVQHSGSEFTVLDDPGEAAREANALYTDTWVSMGQEEEAETRRRLFRGYCIDEELLDRAEENCVVLHCLPAYRGSEITNEVIEGQQSVVFDQAENRLHAQRALLELLMGK